MKQHKQRGFTLIELMIVVAIIGILAAVAYPAYTEQIRKSRRADATAALLGLANAMERHFTANGTYAGARDADNKPTIYAQVVPVDGGAAYYNLRITAADGTSFTVQAQPTGSMTGDTDCGNLFTDNTGALGETGSKDVNYCWRR